jgi:hypothetical protein
LQYPPIKTSRIVGYEEEEDDETIASVDAMTV